MAKRRMLPKPTRKLKSKSKQKRPQSRTLTAVYDTILEDLVYLAEVVGERIRVRLDGARLIKVHLDNSQQTKIEHWVNGIIIAQECKRSYCRKQCGKTSARVFLCLIRLCGSPKSRRYVVCYIGENS